MLLNNFENFSQFRKKVPAVKLFQNFWFEIAFFFLKNFGKIKFSKIVFGVRKFFFVGVVKKNCTRAYKFDYRSRVEYKFSFYDASALIPAK